MARPNKEGLDYFPLDVVLDDKFEFIEAKYGIAGFGIIIKLFQKIYQNGYYLPWNEKALILFSSRIKVDVPVCANIINDCISDGIFDSRTYRKGVLTSSGIQKRYLEAAHRREKIELINVYILIDVSVYKNVIIIDKNTTGSSISVPLRSAKTPQRKEKKSKANKLTFSSDSVEIELSQFLLSLIRQRQPGFQPNLKVQSWAKHIDAMIRIDKRKPEEIKKVIIACQLDIKPAGFCWANNILSTQKLREQFDQLYLKLIQNGGPIHGKTQSYQHQDENLDALIKR